MDTASVFMIYLANGFRTRKTMFTHQFNESHSYNNLSFKYMLSYLKYYSSYDMYMYPFFKITYHLIYACLHSNIENVDENP